MRTIPNQSEKFFLDSFVMIRIGSDTDIGIVLIGSELISIRYLRQGTQSDSIQISNPNHSVLGFIRIDSEWKFGLDQSELRFIRIDAAD